MSTLIIFLENNVVSIVTETTLKNFRFTLEYADNQSGSQDKTI
jgi:hypothetical protein